MLIASCQLLERSDKKRERISRSLENAGRALLLFLAALLFLRTTFFLCCHVSILPFHFSWICGPNKKTATVDCIEILKIEVKKKIDDISDCSNSEILSNRVHFTGNPPFCEMMRSRIPSKASCHACAIIPGRRLFLHNASSPNIIPYTAMSAMRRVPS